MNKSDILSRNFTDLSLKQRYTSQDDTLNDFLVPVIANSKYYYRASGYFSSSILAAAARGLVYFIRNGEKMYLITGVLLSQKDVEAINTGLTTPPEIIEQKLLKELEKTDFEDVIIKKRLEVLAWLVSQGKLEIKLAIPVESEKIKSSPTGEAIWHSKFAIFEDFYGNKLHIEGSINETAKGWIDNAESFSVHRSWIEGERGYILSAEEEFWVTWNNTHKKVRTYTIPDAVKQKLVRIAPKEIKEIVDPEEVLRKRSSSKKVIKLWPHQEEAIQAWYNNGRKGILSMATGSGKTLTALFAIKRLPEDSFVVLLVPTRELVTQWVKEIKWIFPESPMIICSGQNLNWKSTLKEFILAYQRKRNKKFIISTMRSASSDIFIETINQKLGEKYVLIVDEVHRLGAKKSRGIMKDLNPALGRLGLSATPTRIWDDVGTDMIMKYFGGIIYEYSLKDAIRDGRIVPYEYHIEIVPLTEEELYEYKDISRRIYRKYKSILAKYKLPENTPLKEILARLEDKTEVKTIQSLLLKRANIIKKAENKIQKTIEILEKEGDKLGRCLIYCQDTEQLEFLAKEMSRRGYKFLKYLGVHEKEKKANHLRLFREGVVRFLLSIRCLDEGIDIPASDSAVVLASSTSPREFIQRRGRVLRKAPNKEKAIIYDLFVFPYDETYNYDIEPTEIEIFEKELNRSLVFLESAIDSEDTLIKLLRLYRKLIPLGGMDNACGD